jgi:hypothetical protein
MLYWTAENPNPVDYIVASPDGNGGGGGGPDAGADVVNCTGGKVPNPDTGECKCPPGMVEGDGGGCVEYDPCNEISDQMINLSFKAKFDELNKLVGSKKESGYAQNKDGMWIKLEAINDGHSLSFGNLLYKNINGFIHTHINDFQTGRIVDGKTEINKIKRMFSPADVIAFLGIVSHSTDISKVFGAMNSSTGDYVLKFTGNKNPILGLKAAEDYENEYIKYLDKYGTEKGFLKFLKSELKIDGIELYKLHNPIFSDTRKIQLKTLDSKGNVEEVECE